MQPEPYNNPAARLQSARTAQLLRRCRKIPRFQNLRGGIARRQQGLADGADRLLETIIAFAIGHDADTGTERQRPVGDAQNIGKADVLGRPPQGIAALPPPMAAHDPGLFQLQQNGFQEFAGNSLFFGDLGNLHRVTVTAGSQKQQGAQGVTGLLGNHGPTIPHQLYGI